MRGWRPAASLTSSSRLRYRLKIRRRQVKQRTNRRTLLLKSGYRMPAPIVAEDLSRFRWIDHVRLSRDGERVAYQLSWADGEARQNRSRIVVRRLLEPEPVDATAGPRRDHSPEWSPDGRRVAFVSRRGAVDQVFVFDMASPGDARQVSPLA